MTNYFPTQNPHDQSIDAERAWAILGTNQLAGDINLGTIDVGFDINHEEFAERVKIFYESVNIKGVNRKSAYDLFVEEKFTHGTAVLGISSAKSDNNILVAGLEQNSKLLLYDVSSINKPVVNILGYLCKSCLGDEAQLEFDSSSMIAQLKLIHQQNDKNEIFPKVINMSFGEGPLSPMRVISMLKIIEANKNLLVIAAGNKYSNLDEVGYKFPANFNNYNNVMVVGGTNSLGNILLKEETLNLEDKVGSNYGQGVSVVAPGGYELVVLDNSVDVNGLKHTGGTSFSAPQVSALASMIFYLIDNKPDIQKTPEFVKKIIETTADKSKFPSKTINGNSQDSYFYPNVRDTYLARGLISAHQAILLTKALLNEPGFKYTPTKTDKEKKEMSYDKMLFSDNGNYAMALNKHRKTGYRINSDNNIGANPETDFNKFNHGAIWDSKNLSQQGFVALTPEQAKNKYSKSLILEGNKYYLENFDGDKSFEVDLPAEQDRRLMEGGTCSSLLCHEFDSQKGEHILSSRDSRGKHNAALDSGEKGLKAQWFQVEGEAVDGEYVKGDDAVKRTYLNGEEEKILTVWSRTYGLIDNEDRIRRHLLEDFIYNQEQDSDKIMTNDGLHDNEIMYSANREHRILHHKGIVVSQKKDMPVVNNQEVWRDKWVVDITNPSSPYYKEGFADYNEHRLRLTREGQLQYIAVDEENESTVLESINIGSDCDGAGTDSDYAFKLHDDGRILTYTNDNIPLILVVTIDSNSTSALNTQKKLIPLQQTQQANEITYLLSADGSKISFFDGQSINVVQKESDGSFCLNKTPIQKYTP